MTITDVRVAAERYARHLAATVVDDATGADVDELDVDPESRLWLGSIAPEQRHLESSWGDIGERLDPTAIGLRLSVGPGDVELEVEVDLAIWQSDGERWSKRRIRTVRGHVSVSDGTALQLQTELRAALDSVSTEVGLDAAIRTELFGSGDQRLLEVAVVNVGQDGLKEVSPSLFEVQLRVATPAARDFVLASLPDSFRYDRRIPAYGINAGVELVDDWYVTTFARSAQQRRPRFWNGDGAPPDLSFARLAADPLPPLRALVDAHRSWGDRVWSDAELDRRAGAEAWTSEMRDEAARGQADFEVEHERLRHGVDLLTTEAVLLRSFCLMNESIAHSSRGRYPGWRPFQIGFVLATIDSIADPASRGDDADIVWFATGGGKTETYLGLVVMAAIHDRLTGKEAGITAWSRFPLRLLSLQQTQRFADAIAGAEMVRQSHQLGGEPFSVGFLVGEANTPNRIEEDPEDDWKPDPEDETMPARFQTLLECPFCFSSKIEMRFDHAVWTLDHHCLADGCPSEGEPLPFRIVDDEIFRFLPTVVVGTLDKIASVSIQASMAGFFGPPHSQCSRPGHGFTYAKRSTRPQGCLVPGCDAANDPIQGDRSRFAPTFRLQDELHLLRDALGAVDAHYEALLDHLQDEATGTSAKILGSSATLSGFKRQVDVLYRRRGRVFPAAGPSVDEGFWTSPSDEVSRTHVAVAPHGSTMEFASDRIVTVLQTEVRALLEDPGQVCAPLDIDPGLAPDLVRLYATDVVYGNTIRDLEAAARSLETQVQVDGIVNHASLTGQTPFEEVRTTLDRLQSPEDEFDDRIHVVTASSMMSHGVDVDRLNAMVILGLPLTTAEYIQTTARVGRTWPGVVFVIHRMARERDAMTYGSWRQFVEQGDRFVEPVPVTRRSVRVLERTLPGLVFGRLLHVHERKARKALTTIKNLNLHMERSPIEIDDEVAAISAALSGETEIDDRLRSEIDRWLEHFFENLESPPDGARFPREAAPGNRGPMRSLRDVQQVAPIRDVDSIGGR